MKTNTSPGSREHLSCQLNMAKILPTLMIGIGNHNLIVCLKSCLGWKWISFADLLRDTSVWETLRSLGSWGHKDYFFRNNRESVVLVCKEPGDTETTWKAFQEFMQGLIMLPWTRIVMVGLSADPKQESLRKLCQRFCWLSHLYLGGPS